MNDDKLTKARWRSSNFFECASWTAVNDYAFLEPTKEGERRPLSVLKLPRLLHATVRDIQLATQLEWDRDKRGHRLRRMIKGKAVLNDSDRITVFHATEGVLFQTDPYGDDGGITLSIDRMPPGAKRELGGKHNADHWTALGEDYLHHPESLDHDLMEDEPGDLLYHAADEFLDETLFANLYVNGSEFDDLYRQLLEGYGEIGEMTLSFEASLFQTELDAMLGQFGHEYGIRINDKKLRSARAPARLNRVSVWWRKRNRSVEPRAEEQQNVIEETSGDSDIDRLTRVMLAKLNGLNDTLQRYLGAVILGLVIIGILIYWRS